MKKLARQFRFIDIKKEKYNPARASVIKRGSDHALVCSSSRRPDDKKNRAATMVVRNLRP